MDGTYITATRTAAGSALATRLAGARATPTVLAILGAGVQAHSHAARSRACGRSPRSALRAATAQKPRRSRRRSAA